MPLPSDFLSMLTMTATWAQATGADQWGNETYASPVDIVCFLTAQKTGYGGEDHERAEGKKVTTVEIITDAIGAGVNDKIVLSGETYYVTDIDTPKDEAGIDLLHTLTAESVKKG